MDELSLIELKVFHQNMKTMERMKHSSLLVVITSGLVASLSFADDSPVVHHVCGNGHFYDISSNDCKKCSPCPLNHIIRRPCDQLKDTVCGHFNEFENFKQNVHRIKIHGVREQSLNATFNGSVNHHDGTRTVTVTRNTSQDSWSENNGWKGISLVMIGIITVLGLFVAGLLFFVLYRKRKQHKQNIVPGTEFLEMDTRQTIDPLMLDVESSRSHKHSSRQDPVSSSRERLKATGWLLEMNRDKTRVEGSDDSANSSLFPGTLDNDSSDFSADAVFCDSLTRAGITGDRNHTGTDHVV